MGLIKAITGSIGGTMADQWKEFFYCESLPKEVLVTKGKKQVTKRSTNIHGNDNIISNGSGIAVADGQCMMIVEQGKVVEICSEPGQYTYDTSTEPSLFTGGLAKGIRDMFHTMGKRFTYGGATGKDQRVYYFNIKELVDNKFGTSQPIPFRVLDKNIGLDIDVSVRCFGVYSYKISNPMLFYANVCGNVTDTYRREELDTQLKTEFISALQPGFGKLSALGLRPNEIVTHTTELQDAMNEELSAKWKELRGLEIVTVAIGSVTLPPEDAEMIKQAQRTGMLRDPGMAGATLVGAQADALKAAASNEAGAITGLMGVGMIGGMGNGMGMNANQYYNMADQQRQQTMMQNQSADGWTCPQCSKIATGKFCQECGTKKPEGDGGWKCSCGTTNTGKFCSNCGSKRPETVCCSKCGWKPADPTKTPKFCPECGNQF